ncbi:hypothetical protein LQW54_003683 [Pestalotiopsis sp. IQ-011]
MSPTSVYRTFIGLLLSSAAIAKPVVKSEKSRVTYRGTTKNGVEHFQNIICAYDTSGSRRFAPPESYTPPPDSVVDATAPGKACPQSKDAIPPFFDKTPEISEDCLTLRIARPAGAAAGDRIPVVWVQDNIAEFGGDPTRVTAYGLSVGGTAIPLQLVSYGGGRSVPFTQIWAMSGPPGTAINITSDATEIYTLAVAEKLGCEGVGGEEQLSCLRVVPIETLTEAATEYAVANHPPVGGFTFIPSVDGDFLPDR